MAAARQREKAPMSQGVGESRIFAAAESEFPPSDSSGIPPREEWTVGGVPVAGTSFEFVIAWENTDQAIAAREARPHASVEVGIEADVGKKIDRFRDFRTDEVEPWEAPDPMKELVTRHVQPGYRGKFLADAVVDRRGLRGWQPVIAPNGEPVRLGRLTLGEMPEERAQERNRTLLNRSNDNLKQALEQLTEERNRLERETGSSPQSRTTGREDGLLEADSGIYESSLRE